MPSSVLHSFLAKFPKLRAFARRAKFVLWRESLAVRSWGSPLLLDPLRILWVDPRKIE